MYRYPFITMVIAVLWPLSTQAAELTLLAGAPFNADFELRFGDPPPDPLPPGERGDAIAMDSDAVFGVALDFNLKNRKNSRVGVWLSRQSGEFDSGAGLAKSDIEVTQAHFTAMNYYPSGNWEPFVLAGIGVSFFDPADSSLKRETQLSGQIAAGANLRLSDSILFRFEARWVPTFFNGGGSVFCSGGCRIELQSDLYSQFQTNVGLQFRF